MTLGGRAGRVRYHPSGSGVEEFFEVIFDLANGRFAQVKSGFPFDEPEVLRANTIRAAEELLIGPDPAWPWLGQPLG